MAETALEPTISKMSAQLKKLQDANNRYKSLLKLAKDRIQSQEEELQSIRETQQQAEASLTATSKLAIEIHHQDEESSNSTVVYVCQRVQAKGSNGHAEIWALFDMEAAVEPSNTANDISEYTAVRRYKEWKQFDTEAQLQDYIRRDTGEPLSLPPYSLSPDQSAQIQQTAEATVAKLTDDFRRFRVKAELARNQQEAQIREMQSLNAQSAAQRIVGNDMQQELEQARMVGTRLEQIKRELVAQEAHWKEAYDVLLAENTALKSSGSEALLASQWRHRYETTLQEKADLESQLKTAQSKLTHGNNNKYEAKYRDLKESFQLYRKKAKEIFETQERGGIVSPPGMASFAMNDASSAEAKISYLKNLMVNYLSSDATVRDHMETAIGTILRFSPDDLEKIEKRKAANETWF